MKEIYIIHRSSYNHKCDNDNDDGNDDDDNDDNPFALSSL